MALLHEAAEVTGIDMHMWIKTIKSACWAILWFVAWLAFFAGVLAFFYVWLAVSLMVWMEQTSWPYNWLFIAEIVVMAVAIPVLLKIGSKALKTEDKESIVYLGLGAALLPVALLSYHVRFHVRFMEWLISAVEIDWSDEVLIAVWIVLVAVIVVASPVLFSIGSRALRTKEKVPLICLALGVALLCVMAVIFPKFLSAFY